MSEADHNPFAAPQIADAPVKPDGHVNFEALRTAGNGLGLIYISLVLIVLMFVGIFMAGLVLQRGGPAEIRLVLVLGAAVGTLVLTIVSLVGGIMCTTVPHESGAKGFAIASVVLHGLNVLAMIVSIVFGGVLGAGPFGLTAVNLFSCISIVVFVLFLGRLSKFIHRLDLARRATKVLVMVAIALVTGIGSFAMAFSTDGLVTAAIVIIAFGLFVAAFLMYANLINEVGKTLRNPDRAPKASHIG